MQLAPTSPSLAPLHPQHPSKALTPQALTFTEPTFAAPHLAQIRLLFGLLALLLTADLGWSLIGPQAAHAAPSLGPQLSAPDQWSPTPRLLPGDQAALRPSARSRTAASSFVMTRAAFHTSARGIDAFGVLRRPQLAMNGDLLTAGLIVLIPTVAIELTLFIGNLAAFSTSKRQLAWGIQGMAFSILGGAVTLPWILLGLQEGIAVSFIALHLALLGVGIANIVMGLQQKRQNRRVAFMPWGHVSPTGVAQGGIACAGIF